MVKLPWKTAWRFLKKLQGITIWSSRYIPRHILKRMKIHTCIKIFMWMIIAVLFLIANRWEKNQMSINWKTDKQNAVHIYWPTYSRYIQLGIYNVRVLVTSHVWIFATPWTVAHKAPLSMSRIREWIAISFSRGSSWPRIEPGSPVLQADPLPSELLMLQHRDYTLYDYTHMKYPEWPNQQRQRVYEWLSKAERTGETGSGYC